MVNKALLTAGLAGTLCLSAWAQENPRFEVGLKGGVGVYSYMDDRSHQRGVVGAEVCAFCGGRFALFGGYSHFLPPGAPSGYQSANLVEGGLRIQGRRRVRPFFDAGAAVGNSRFSRGTGTRTVTTAGAALGAGVMIQAGPHLYLRPQGRFYIMSQQYVAAAAEVGIGWRF
jgi:hypothetical protein